MIKVSILVPICNVEKFLDKCLESIVRQTLTDIEVICINDGSKDRSLEIIKKYAALDSRIVLIDKSNSGYGDSMNKGLDIARGEYVGIVESDDFINDAMYDELYTLAIRYNADVVKSNYCLYWGQHDEIIKFNNNLRINDVTTCIDECKARMLWRAQAIWSAIYKRSFLIEKGVKFLATPGASYQDTSFNFKVAALAGNVALTPKAYLNYRQDNTNSSVKMASKEKVLMLHKEYDEIERFIVQIDDNKLKPVYITQRFRGYLWNYGRIKNDLKRDYFDIFADEIIEISKKDEIYRKQLVNIFGNLMYKALLKKNKLLFDISLKLFYRKEKTYKSLLKRGLIREAVFKWL